MNITFVLPSIYISSRPGDQENKEPLGILYLTSALRNAGNHVEFIDANRYGLSVEQTVDMILKTDCEMVGLSIVQRTIATAIAIAQEIRKRGSKVKVLFGGFFPTLAAEELAEYGDCIDVISIGEGEESLVELVDKMEKNEDWRTVKGLAWIEDSQVKFSEKRDKIKDLDAIAFPARDFLPEIIDEIGYASMISSRGCYGNCSFCSQRAFDSKSTGARWRGRSAKSVVDEIEYLVNKYNVKLIKFNDDNVFGPGENGKDRVIEICNEILKRKIKVKLMAFCRANDVTKDVMTLMKKAGFQRILLGVENVNNDILRKYRKGETIEQIKNSISILKEVGISITPGFMMFDPYSNLTDIKNNLNFLRTSKSYGVSLVKNVIVHYGTYLRESLEKEHRLRKGNVLEEYYIYNVDISVARVYYANKFFWIKVIDPILRESKYIIESLKRRATGFNDRYMWEEALEKLWLIQANVLDLILSSVQEKVGRKEIVEGFKQIFKEIDDVIKVYKSFVTKDELESFNNYKLANYRINNKEYFIDVLTSKVFEVDEPYMYRGLRYIIVGKGLSTIREMIANEFSEEEADKFYDFAKKELRHDKIYVRQEVDVDQFIEQEILIMTSSNKDYLTEKYVWNPEVEDLIK